MNHLPASRRAINGRTWGRTWSAADFDPIQHFESRRISTACRWAGRALAAFIGVGLAVVLAIGWAR